MSSTEVDQCVKPKYIKQKLGADVPQSTLAYLAEIGEGALSGGLAGRLGFSTKAQAKIMRALGFFSWMRERFHPAPINFRDVKALEPFWKEYLKLSDASAVARTKDE